MWRACVEKSGRSGGENLRGEVASAGSISEELGIVRNDERLDSPEGGEAFVIVDFIILEGLEPGAAKRVGLGGVPEEGVS